MAPFWIHCNICNELLSKETEHYLLSCNHILCKNCMKGTKGKICILCKSNIRFLNITKLPDKMQKHFKTKAEEVLIEPANIFKFQQTQIQSFARKTLDYKKKTKQLMEIYEKEKKEIIKLDKQYKAVVQKRQQMQEKLKEIYIQNQKKHKNEIYRNTANSTLSSGFSSDKIGSSSHTPSTSGSGFFNQNNLYGRDSSSVSSDFFKQKSTIERSKHIDHTQSDRTPFFA